MEDLFSSTTIKFRSICLVIRVMREELSVLIVGRAC